MAEIDKQIDKLENGNIDQNSKNKEIANLKILLDNFFANDISLIFTEKNW